MHRLFQRLVVNTTYYIITLFNLEVLEGDCQLKHTICMVIQIQLNPFYLMVTLLCDKKESGLLISPYRLKVTVWVSLITFYSVNLRRCLFKSA